MEGIVAEIFFWFREYFTGTWAVFLTAMLPVAELRLAVPLGISLGLHPLKVFILAVLGNMLPVFPLLYLLHPVRKFLRNRSVLMDRFFSWLEGRTYKKRERIDKYGALGLIFFTAIPLPTTGAWTACLAAVLFKIDFKYAFLAILTGVIVAGIAVTTVAIIAGELLI